MELLLESLIIIFNFCYKFDLMSGEKKKFGLVEKAFQYISHSWYSKHDLQQDPQWFCAIDSQFLCHGSSRNRSVPRTRRRDIAETLRLIPESAALPLISSSFSRFSSSSVLPQSPPSLFFSSFQFSFFSSFFASSFLLFFSLYLLVS